MVDGCGATLSKMILFVLNALVWVVSIALIALGAYVLANQGKYAGVFGTNTNTLVIVCGTVLGVGCLIFLTAFCGCCGAMKESSCLLKMYIGILVILILVEVIGGILALVFRGSIRTFLSEQMQTQVTKSYGKKDQEAVTTFLDGFQEGQSCCGVENYTDYLGSAFQKANPEKFVPLSCCKDQSVETCNDASGDDIADPDLIFSGPKQGCLPILVNFFEDNFLYIGAAALALVAFEILASIFACCVIGGIKRGEYE
ncbi:CD151 antigen-like [Asterias rubens]|uniref:CD151 antigen-like n=1 Tax=Asterias rubens TaxID=7604 RepID=UPI001455119F|nr:CD151 antigen-like [Asterias rubens]